MLLSAVATLLACVSATVLGFPNDYSCGGGGGGGDGDEGEHRCTRPYIRKEWRSLTERQQDRYIRAVKCMMAKPGTLQLDAIRNRYDDFVGAHSLSGGIVHFAGIFYPYHRLLLREYERALWQCGWDRRLGQPYWDWTLDAGSREAFLSSPILDPIRGFGGNGDYIPGNRTNPQLGPEEWGGGPPVDIPDRSGGGCLKDGAFAGLTTFFGPLNKTERTRELCIRRDFSYISLRNLAGPTQVAAAMRLPDYGAFEFVTDVQSFHSGGHGALGAMYGTMTDQYTSPADPVFWLHHSSVDRAWWSWQQRDLARRERDISGPLVSYDYGNQKGGNATADTPVVVLLEPRLEFKAGDLGHIQKGPFCYAYDALY